jgi:hypothetical protein
MILGADTLLILIKVVENSAGQGYVIPQGLKVPIQAIPQIKAPSPDSEYLQYPHGYGL